MTPEPPPPPRNHSTSKKKKHTLTHTSQKKTHLCASHFLWEQIPPTSGESSKYPLNTYACFQITWNHLKTRPVDLFFFLFLCLSNGCKSWVLLIGLCFLHRELPLRGCPRNGEMLRDQRTTVARGSSTVAKKVTRRLTGFQAPHLIGKPLTLLCWGGGVTSKNSQFILLPENPESFFFCQAPLLTQFGCFQPLSQMLGLISFIGCCVCFISFNLFCFFLVLNATLNSPPLSLLEKLPITTVQSFKKTT